MYDAKKIPVEDFFKMPKEAEFKISPDGKFISYLKPYNKRLNIFIKSTLGGEEIRLTDCEDRNIARYIYANDSRIVYLKDNNGDENFRLFAVDIDGKNLKEIAGFEGVTVRIVDELINDNDHILISMNKRNKQIFDVYKLNIYTGDMEIAAENLGKIMQWLTDNNGEIRVGIELDGVNTRVLFREKVTDPFTLILESDYKETSAPVYFTEDNKNLIVVSNVGRDKYAIYEFDPIKGENIKLIYENNEVDVSGLGVLKKSHKLICAIYVTDKLQYKFFNKKAEEIYNKLKSNFSNDIIELKDLDREENKIIIEAYSDRNPGVYYLYDIEKDLLTKIAEEKPWINPEEMSEMKPIKYTSRDGLTIHGYLTIPKGAEEKNLPVVVNPHGGPWGRDVWGFKGDVQFLANRGYAVFQMDFRTSTGYGKKFLEAGYKQWDKLMDDITDGVNWLIKEEIADPNRVAIYGGSFGGYAALAGLTFTPDLYTCGVDVDGMSSIFTMFDNMPPYWVPVKGMMCEMIGDPEKDKELLMEISPLFHVDNIKKPLLIAQGANDQRVPRVNSDKMVEALRNRGIEVKYMLKENEGHGFFNEENVLELYSEIEKFFEQHII